MPTEENTISFRLPQELHEELKRVAEASGSTKHHFARSLVIQSLGTGRTTIESPTAADIDEAFKLLSEAIADLRLGMGRGIGVVLQEVSPHRDREEIRRWVFDRIITQSKPTGERDGA